MKFIASENMMYSGLKIGNVAKRKKKKCVADCPNYLIFQKTELNLLSEAAVSRFGLI